jgi:putative transcriptional regulator
MDGQMSKRIEFYIKGQPKLPKPYHLTSVGLPNVYLLNGVAVENDPDYGKLITITNVSGLHTAICLSLLWKSGALNGDELRFLRKQMQMTQETLAERFRVNVQTVANYEKGKTDVAGSADRLARLLYVVHILPEDHEPELFNQIARAIAELMPEPKVPERVRKQFTGSWREDGHGLAA